MRKGEGTIAIRRVAALDAHLGRGISRATIMIAAHQQDPELTMPRAPLREVAHHLLTPPSARMQEISQENDAGGLSLLEHGVDALQG